MYCGRTPDRCERRRDMDRRGEARALVFSEPQGLRWCRTQSGRAGERREHNKNCGADGAKTRSFSREQKKRRTIGLLTARRRRRATVALRHSLAQQSAAHPRVRLQPGMRPLTTLNGRAPEFFTHTPPRCTLWLCARGQREECLLPSVPDATLCCSVERGVLMECINWCGTTTAAFTS